LFFAACDANAGPDGQHKQSMKTNSGVTITYNADSQDVLLRLFSGGGKVGTLEFTPEITIYGDGTFIIGPGLQPQKGSLSNDQLQSLLRTLIGTDNILQLPRQNF